MRKRLKKKKMNIPSMKVIKLEKDDVICLKSNKCLRADEVYRIKESIENVFPNNKVIILTGSLNLSIIKNGSEE